MDDDTFYGRIDSVDDDVFAELSSERITIMKRKDLTVFWQLRDDGGFWRVDATVYRNSDNFYEPSYRLMREFEKKTMRDQSVDTIMKRAEGYLQFLIDNGDLDAWYSAPVDAAP
jgi:hypothetical protein